MSFQTTILIIDDEPQIRRVVRNALAILADRIIDAPNGREGIDAAAAASPSLVVLDLGLPDLPGVEVCRDIRSWSQAPIIVLSARHSDSEKVGLLDAGADDYVTKPFSTDELQARVRAQLRRARMIATPAEGGAIQVDGLQIDLVNRTVTRSGGAIHLTPTEWSLLRAFVKHGGRTLTHQQIFREVWGRAAGDAHTYLRVHIANLRRKIEADPVRPRLILTEPGVGYRFETVP
jgi:two-component system, OmpR family, KDP operon response regulator KdpE